MKGRLMMLRDHTQYVGVCTLKSPIVSEYEKDVRSILLKYAHCIIELDPELGYDYADMKRCIVWNTMSKTVTPARIAPTT